MISLAPAVFLGNQKSPILKFFMLFIHFYSIIDVMQSFAVIYFLIFFTRLCLIIRRKHFSGDITFATYINGYLVINGQVIYWRPLYAILFTQ